MLTCTLQLDNFFGEYYPGNTIRGTVLCWFPKRKKITGIEVRLKGTEYTRWLEKLYNPFTKNAHQTIHQSGSNSFLNERTTLAGRVIHPAGRYAYHFTLRLPNNLPGTYESKHGWILYNITSIIIIPSSCDLRDTKEIKIVAPIDFNKIQIPMVPLSYMVKKDYSQSSVSYGPIIMKVHLERSAYAQGEMIRVRVNIRNMSTINIARVEARLEMTIKFTSEYPHIDSKTESEVLVTAGGSGVEANGVAGLLFGLRVPESTVVPNFRCCKLFRQSAAIYVTAVLAGAHANMEFRAPIKLGNIAREEQHCLPYSPPASPTAPPPNLVLPLSLAGALPSTNNYRPPIAYIELLPPHSDFDAIPCVPFYYCPVILPHTPGSSMPSAEEFTIPSVPSPPSSIPNESPTEQPEGSTRPWIPSPPSFTLNESPTGQPEESIRPWAPSSPSIPNMSPTDQSEDSSSWVPSPSSSVRSLSPMEQLESTGPCVPPPSSSIPSVSPVEEVTSPRLPSPSLSTATEQSEESPSPSFLSLLSSASSVSPTAQSEGSPSPSFPSLLSSASSVSSTEQSEGSPSPSFPSLLSSASSVSPMERSEEPTSSSVSSRHSPTPSVSPTELSEESTSASVSFQFSSTPSVSSTGISEESADLSIPSSLLPVLSVSSTEILEKSLDATTPSE